MEIKIRRNETSENLIKRFTRKMKKENIIEEYLERRYYKKSSEKKREKHQRQLAEIERQKRKEQESNDY
tara:strand:+ start:2296 stop:2502 length:207 start_codon:yes stop_codon:yes gene_type:complete